MDRVRAYIGDAHGEFSFGVDLKVGLLVASVQVENVHFACITTRGNVLSIRRETDRPCVSLGIKEP